MVERINDGEDNMDDGLTIIDEDWELAEDIQDALSAGIGYGYLITKSTTAIIARHREKREKRLVEALRQALAILEIQPDAIRTDTGERGDAELNEAIPMIRQSLKEYDQ